MITSLRSSWLLKQILLISALGNAQRTVWKICILILGCKGLRLSYFPYMSFNTDSFGVLFATLVKYFYDVPASDAITFIGFPISGKIFIYSMALQVSSFPFGPCTRCNCLLCSGFGLH